jgi:hypothetical protein
MMRRLPGSVSTATGFADSTVTFGRPAEHVSPHDQVGVAEQ